MAGLSGEFGGGPTLQKAKKTVDPHARSVYIHECHPKRQIALCNFVQPSVVSRIIF
jgi:hypothetical protein